VAVATEIALKGRCRVSAAKFAADVFAGLMNDLESYGDAFERTARTEEQKMLARGFKELVRQVPRLILIAAKREPNQSLIDQVFPRPRGRGR
jgi:hypothetical protein